MQKQKKLKDLKKFHEAFTEFLKIIVFMENALNSFNETLVDFCLNDCSEHSNFNELEEAIQKSEIKNNRNTKYAKFTLKIYPLVYQRLMNFPLGEFVCETLTTPNCFENIRKLINIKIHLNHLHITGKIYGYAHDFFNMKFR